MVKSVFDIKMLPAKRGMWLWHHLNSGFMQLNS